MKSKEHERDERLYLLGHVLEALIITSSDGAFSQPLVEQAAEIADEAWRSFKKREDRMAALEIAAATNIV